MRLQLRQLVYLAITLWSLTFSPSAYSFVIEDIRVEGLQRIPAGTVFNYLPLAVGDEVTNKNTATAIRTLYKTGFFQDIQLQRDGNVLIVLVHERPAIAEITIEGNQDIKTEDLLQALKDIGLAEGRVFSRSVLDRIEQELRRQYFNQGKYGLQIESSATPLERNRVAVAIHIVEGEVARIKQINIIGNEDFDTDELLDEFKLGTTGFWSFISRNDRYSKQQLAGDVEALRSFYLDRGYINFKIESTQVSISPDKQDIYITVVISEGEVYHVGSVQIAGDLVLAKDELLPLVELKPNTVFSRKQATTSTENINDLLGNRGYAFANVNVIPEIDDEQRKVDLTFFLDPGKRVYVRRINMQGNTRTRDEVLRRELRQMETAWYSAEKIKQSRERLQRLGYFEEVNIETPTVSGTADQLDVNIKVTEKPSGSFLAGIGYGQGDGILLNASITQDNFLGTGKRVSLAFNTSSANRVYKLHYTNPYYTIDGISRGFTLLYRQTEFDELDSADYSTDVALAGMNFGIPISELGRVGLDINLEQTDFKLGSDASDEIIRFVDAYGDSYRDLRSELSWTHDSRNSAWFPVKGALHRASVEATVPGSDLTYYKLRYSQKRYFPLFNDFAFKLTADLGYGDGYGDLRLLPFYENFFAGGRSTVRGFKSNSLGPRDSNDDPLGGNLRVLGGAALLIPTPGEKLSKTLRLSAFIDGGNVFAVGEDIEGSDQAGFDFSEIRYSAGVAATWLSPIGILAISLAQPLNDKDGDDIENFQFSFGQTF